MAPKYFPGDYWKSLEGRLQSIKILRVLHVLAMLATYGKVKQPRLSKKVEKWQNRRALFPTAVGGAFRPGVMAAQRFLVPLVWVRILGAELFAF